jgi:prepilin-type N-terminal cleavage/methylation domain-containing protein
MRGFSLIEAMAALALAGIIGGAIVGIFTGAVRDGGDQGAEWQAVSIAQQQMERLAALPKNLSSLTPDLVDSTADTQTPGSLADRNCTGGVDGRLTPDMKVNELGVPDPNGRFTLCWKNTANHPTGVLINTRVIVTFAGRVGQRNVMMQTLR